MYQFSNLEEVQEKTNLQMIYGKEYYNVEDSGLMYIGGVRGSYKSTCARILCAAALNPGKPICNFLFNDMKDKEVVIADTEMAPALVEKGGKSLLKLAGLTKVPRSLKIYGMSGYTSWRQKREAFKDMLEDLSNPGLIVIDNPRDFISDSTSPDEAKSLIDELNAYAINHKCFIVCISHITDSALANGKYKLYGHFGSMLANTSSCGFMMVPLTDSALITGHKNRWGDFPSLELKMSQDFMPYVSDYNPFPLWVK